MSKKIIIIVGGVVLGIVVLGTTVFLLNNHKESPVNQIPNIFGTDVPPDEAEKTYKEIPRTDGGSVSVPDFTKGNEPISGFEGSYYDLVNGSGPIYGNEGYSFEIQYDETNAEFLVVLIEEPLGESRREAEDFLRNKLSLKDEELCKLNIFVAVPLDVNEVYSQYPNLGLSFCPSGVPLP